VTPPPAKLSGPIVIRQQPESRAIPRGSTTTFQVLAEGSEPIGYRWLFKGVEILAATNASLLITNAQLSDEGSYSVVVSNSYGSVQSSAVALVVLIPPVITLNPVSQSVVAGGSLTMSATAEGNPLPLTFCWNRDGLPMTNVVVNGTNCFLTLTDFQAGPATNEVNFSVAVTNLAGCSSPSSSAVVRVLADTDGDGMPDEWESANNLNPANSADAALDSDSDGMSNADEYLAGTDPLDKESYLKVEYIMVEDSPPTASIAFVAFARKTYSVLRRDSMEHGPWIPIADVPATSTNRLVVVRDSTARTPGQIEGFYRLVTPRLAP
jgi:hypothetical protein